MNKRRQFHYVQHIASDFTSVEEVTQHVENSDEHLWLLEFEKKDNVLSANVLAVSNPVLAFMSIMGISENIANKQLFNWFNRFADYMEKAGDEEGAIAFRETQQSNYNLTLQGKQPMPLRVCVKIGELVDAVKYLAFTMSAEFVVEGETDIMLSRSDIEEITQEQYERRVRTGTTVTRILNDEAIIEGIDILKDSIKYNRELTKKQKMLFTRKLKKLEKLRLVTGDNQ